MPDQSAKRNSAFRLIQTILPIGALSRLSRESACEIPGPHARGGDRPEPAGRFGRPTLLRNKVALFFFAISPFPKLGTLVRCSTLLVSTDACLVGNSSCSHRLLPRTQPSPKKKKTVGAIPCPFRGECPSCRAELWVRLACGTNIPRVRYTRFSVKSSPPLPPLSVFHYGDRLPSAVCSCRRSTAEEPGQH